MRQLTCATLLLILVAARPPAARTQAPAANSDAAANAALQYWQGFSQMPVLEKAERMLLDPATTDSLDKPEVEKLIAASRTSVKYMHRAAKLKVCDWGLEYGDGLGLLLPHLAKGRDLALLAALHARYEFAHGNRDALRESASAIMKMGRHVGRDPIMIGVLVRYAIDDIAIDLLAPYIPEIKAPHEQFAAMFEALPPAPSMSDAIKVEQKYFVEWMIKRLKDVEREKPGAWQAEWKSFFPPSETEPALQAVGTVRTFEQAIEQTEALLPLFGELQRIVDLPKDKFEIEYPPFKKKALAKSPLAELILPAVDKVIHKKYRNRARLAMLLAAIAVAEGGPEKLKELKDPFGSGPFEYRKVDGGFELKSALTLDGEPVTLRVGRAK